MATIKRFEEMDIWQMARKQSAGFFALVQAGRFREQFSLKDQMDRSSGSVMDNIAEGFDRNSRADFKHFLVIARGSNAEFRSQLYRCLDRNLISPDEFENLKKATEHLGVKTHHFIGYLLRSIHKEKPADNPLSEVRKETKKLEEPTENYLFKEPDTLPDWFNP